jgi:hypothetical protein
MQKGLHTWSPFKSHKTKHSKLTKSKMAQRSAHAWDPFQLGRVGTCGVTQCSLGLLLFFITLDTSQYPTVGLCLGPCGGPRGWAVSHERGAPVAARQAVPGRTPQKSPPRDTYARDGTVRPAGGWRGPPRDGWARRGADRPASGLGRAMPSPIDGPASGMARYGPASGMA